MPRVYHPVMESIVFVLWLIMSIYRTLLLSPGFLWVPRSTETLGRGSGPCDQVASYLAAALWAGGPWGCAEGPAELWGDRSPLRALMSSVAKG